LEFDVQISPYAVYKIGALMSQCLPFF